MHRSSQHRVATAVAAAALVGPATIATASGEFIATQYTNGGPGPLFGRLEPFSEPFNYKFGVVPHETDLVALFDDPTLHPGWLFEMDGLDSSYEGQTFIADETNPNFALFESIVTNGSSDIFTEYGEFVLDDPIPGSTLKSYPDDYIIDPLEPTHNDLQGYDLTEVHLTFEVLDYVSGPAFPGGPIGYAYVYWFRVDFYGNAIPAPGALALFGFAAVRRRRRRSE